MYGLFQIEPEQKSKATIGTSKSPQNAWTSNYINKEFYQIGSATFFFSMTNIFESNKTILYINLTRTVMSTLQKISSRYMYMIFFYQSCVYLGSFFVLVFEPHWGDVITSPVKALKRYSNSFRSFTSRWCCRACNITNRDQCIVSPSIIHTKLSMQLGRIKKNIHVKSSSRRYGHYVAYCPAETLMTFVIF